MYCGERLVLIKRYRALKIISQGIFGRNFKCIDESKSSNNFCIIKQFFLLSKGSKDLEIGTNLFFQKYEFFYYFSLA